MKNKLKRKLIDVGHNAEMDIPDASQYTYCCGLFYDKNSPAIKARIIVLKLIYWLRKLARETSDEPILKAALYLADKYIQPHREFFGEIDLFKELDELKIEFDIHYSTDNTNALKDFSADNGHMRMPKMIKAYLASHAIALEITYWLNVLTNETEDDSIIQAAVYVADKFLKHHQDTLGESELFEELEQYKTSHGIHFSKENIHALFDFSQQNDHIHIPKMIEDYWHAQKSHLAYARHLIGM